MYCEHFGLTRQPFKITPDTSLFFSGGERGATLEAVAYAIISGAGITKVVGEVGTGKTMLCRMLEVRLPNNVDIVYIANPGISPENILNVIAFEMGLITAPISKLEVMQLLQQRLLRRHSEGRQVVVLIEEAQAMPLETLEEIRLLSNLETEQDKLMQMVLFGQPELDANLLKPSIRQLSERIVHSFYLGPLKKDQIRDYLNFRVHSAGYHSFGLFNDVNSALIASVSKGLLRRINILADKSLLAAYADSSQVIEKRHVIKAIKDSNFNNPKWYRKLFLKWSAAATVSLFIVMASVQLFLVNSTGDVKGVENSRVSDKSISSIETTPQFKINADSAIAIDPQSETSIAQLPSTSIIDQRELATRLWLNATDEIHYSIQIMFVEQKSEEKLHQFLELLAEAVNINDVYIYKSSLDGKGMYGVLYKMLATHQEARHLMQQMPTVVKGMEPFVIRTTRSVRDETIKYNS